MARRRLPDAPGPIGGDSQYLRSKGIWNDPGSGRFAPRGFSTLKALALQLVGGEQVRDAAEVNGTVWARVADNRMSRAGIKKGDVIEVAYMSDEKGRVKVRSASGKDRFYDVQWARFSEVVDKPVTPEPEPKPEPKPEVVTPDQVDVPNVTPPAGSGPEAARAAALSILADLPDDPFALPAARGFTRPAPTDIFTDTAIGLRVNAVIQDLTGAPSPEEAKLVPSSRIIPGMPDTVTMGDIGMSTRFVVWGQYGRKNVGKPKTFETVGALNVMSNVIVSALAEKMNATPDEREQWRQAMSPWADGVKPANDSARPTPSQLSPWGKALLSTSQITMPLEAPTSAYPSVFAFSNDEQREQLMALFGGDSPVSVETTSGPIPGATLDRLLAKMTVGDLAQSVDRMSDQREWPIETLSNRQSFWDATRKAVDDSSIPRIDDLTTASPEERSALRGHAVAALIGDGPTSTAVGNNGLGALFTTPMPPDGSFTEDDLTPFGKVMYRAWSAHEYNMRPERDPQTTLSAVDNERLDTIVRAGSVLLDDMRRVEDEKRPKPLTAEDAQKAYDDAKATEQAARAAFAKDVAPKIAGRAIKRLNKEDFHKITFPEGADYKIEMNETGVGFQLVLDDGTRYDVDPRWSQRTNRVIDWHIRRQYNPDGSVEETWVDQGRATTPEIEAAENIARLAKLRADASGNLARARIISRFDTPADAEAEGASIRDSVLPGLLREWYKMPPGTFQTETTAAVSTTDGEALSLSSTGSLPKFLDKAGISLDSLLEQMDLTNAQPTYLSGHSLRYRRTLVDANGNDTQYAIIFNLGGESAGIHLEDTKKKGLNSTVGMLTFDYASAPKLRDRANTLAIYLNAAQSSKVDTERALPAVRADWAEVALDGGGTVEIDGGAKTDRAKGLESISRVIPKNLLEAQGGVRVNTKGKGRSYYTDGDTTVSLKDDSQSTALHELGHHLERNRELNRMVWAYYTRRTGGDSAPVQSLSKLLPGYGYRKDEMTRPDKFHSAYAGKAYGSAKRNGNAHYELLTMGLQGVIFNDGGDVAQKIDDDYASFILGSLLLASRNTGAGSGGLGDGSGGGEPIGAPAGGAAVAAGVGPWPR